KPRRPREQALERVARQPATKEYFDIVQWPVRQAFTGDHDQPHVGCGGPDPIEVLGTPSRREDRPEGNRRRGATRP
ncbi:MAG TPA: hypothetical protein VNF73_16725, partial [Candidatus Saccharimonadales bacterium]|nr:hypothetical protein [Candidatus Saccharimonadales bacterium]